MRHPIALLSINFATNIPSPVEIYRRKAFERWYMGRKIVMELGKPPTGTHIDFVEVKPGNIEEEDHPEWHIIQILCLAIEDESEENKNDIETYITASSTISSDQCRFECEQMYRMYIENRMKFNRFLAESLYASIIYDIARAGRTLDLYNIEMDLIIKDEEDRDYCKYNIREAMSTLLEAMSQCEAAQAEIMDSSSDIELDLEFDQLYMGKHKN